MGKTGESRSEGDWQYDIDDLIDLGNRLNLETPIQGRWRTDSKTGEIWKPTCGDAWIAENLKIRTKIGEPVLLELNPVQREYSRTCLEKDSKKNIVLKARQLGITSYIAARFFVRTIVRKGTLTMLVAHDREAAEEIFRIVHRFWNNLPDEFRKGALKASRRSARELVFPRLDSEFSVTSADENAGRGRTIQNLHCTEVSRWGRDGEEALASLRAALVPGGEIVLESTANGAGGQFYEEWQRAEETGYTKHFFPWWYEENYVAPTRREILVLTEEETALMNSYGLKVEQIAWRRQQWASLRGLAAQEFSEDPVSCFRASGECVFELESIDLALASTSEPLEARDNSRLKIWLPAQAGREYVIGVDPAGGGILGDYSCGEVIDRKLGTQCAELRGHWPPRELARKLADLGKEYNRALLAVEKNNHGHAVLLALEDLGYPNLFTQKEEVGWLTTSKNRPEMIEGLATAVFEDPRLFRSSMLLNEFRTFVRFIDGKTGATAGAHDDCVIAMGIAWAVRDADAGRGAKRRLELGSMDK